MVVTSLDAAGRRRFALVVALLGVASILATAAVAPTTTAQALVILAALSATTCCVGVQALLAVPTAGRRSLRPDGRAAAVPSLLSTRATDVAHHPARPRAPGLV